MKSQMAAVWNWLCYSFQKYEEMLKLFILVNCFRENRCGFFVASWKKLRKDGPISSRIFVQSRCDVARSMHRYPLHTDANLTTWKYHNFSNTSSQTLDSVEKPVFLKWPKFPHFGKYLDFFRVELYLKVSFMHIFENLGRPLKGEPRP